MIPGKESYYTTGTVSLPSVSGLRQYPTSLEVPISTITDQGL